MAFCHASYCIQDSLLILDPAHGLGSICEDGWNQRRRNAVLVCRAESCGNSVPSSPGMVVVWRPECSVRYPVVSIKRYLYIQTVTRFRFALQQIQRVYMMLQRTICGAEKITVSSNVYALTSYSANKI